MTPLRVALAKGRLLEDALALFARAGLPVRSDDRDSRRLRWRSADGRLEFLPLKSFDVPLYVEAGVADAGVVGSDVLDELEPEVLQTLDLGFGRCRMVIASRPDVPYPHLDGGVLPRVATKYPNTARRALAQRGVQAELVRVAGSVEVAPLLGLAHWIVDLTETGRTLRDNGLVVREVVATTSARWIVNRASHKLRLSEHRALEQALGDALNRAKRSDAN